MTLYNGTNEDVKNNMNEFLFTNIFIVSYLKMWVGKLHLTNIEYEHLKI